MAPDAKIREIRKEIIAKAKQRIDDYLYPQSSEEIAGRRRLIDQPPALFHVSKEREPEHQAIVQEALDQYRSSLPDERRVHFDQNERDYAALVAAVKAGKVVALVEEDLV